MLAHQLASERQRILADGVRELVDETFQVNRIVVDVYAAPEPGNYVRIAHRMLDQEVRHRIADRSIAGGIEASEAGRIHAVDHRLRSQCGQD